MKAIFRFCTSVLIILATTTMLDAQTFSLSTFESQREKLEKELKLTEKEAVQVNNIYSQLDKQLLNLNEEINGKNKDQVESLIEKKYKKANESLRSVLSPADYKQVQEMNKKELTTITNGLIGTHGLIETKGLIGTNGIITTKGKRSEGIVMGTARER